MKTYEKKKRYSDVTVTTWRLQWIKTVLARVRVRLRPLSLFRHGHDSVLKREMSPREALRHN